MCIIIIKQKGSDVPLEVIKRSSSINPHGLGVVWLDTFKTTFHQSEEINVLNTDRPFIAHFRYATVGKVSVKNTHPFKCGSNHNELLMQNGTVFGYGSKTMTDTEDLAIRLGQTPRHTWKNSLEKFDSRFVTINTRNRTFQIYNKKDWIKQDNVWYSKSNVLQNNVVATYGTLQRGQCNHHHIGRGEFIGKGKTLDKYPLVIDGLPYVYKERGVGHNVSVEVFKVSDEQLKQIDSLEGHPKWYKREVTDIVIGTETVKAWMYFMTTPRNKSRVLYDKFDANTKARNQKTFWDEVELVDESPYCIECFNDLTHDGFTHYHCSSCNKWFHEQTVGIN